MDVMIKHFLKDIRVRAGLALISATLIGFGGWLLYSIYRHRANEQAQLTFAAVLDRFTKLQENVAGDKAAWELVARDLEQAYEQHRSSDFAPFYLGYEAEAILEAGNVQESISVLERMLQQIDTAHPLYYLYKTKLNVIRSRAADKAVQEEGARELRALADDIHNPCAGWAWYVIWHAAWVDQNDEVAQHALQKLVAHKNWYTLAQAKSEFLA